MLDIIPPALAAVDSAVQPLQFEVNWSMLGPVIINALATIGALAYTFGVVNQKIRAIDRDLEKMQVDFERIREQNRDTDQRIHDMSIVLTKIDTRLDMFLSAAGDTGACPHFKAQLVSRSKETP